MGDRRKLLVSRWWLQGSILVFLFGFFVLGLLAWRTYDASPPIPDRVLDDQGDVLFTRADILRGQRQFLESGLMEYGSVFGHGGYLGPDYTAEYLRRAAEEVRGNAGSQADPQTVEVFRTNRYDPDSGALVFTQDQAEAFEKIASMYARRFSSREPGALRPAVIPDVDDARALTSFFAWTAWAAAAERPGADYSYTNNWPPEPRVGNVPTADMLLWSTLSLAALLGGIGIVFAAYGRWGRRLGWHGREADEISFRDPAKVGLTPAQRACAWFFLVMVVLFLGQAVVGAASQHYRVEVTGFFGYDLSSWFPFNLARTWHVQLAIFWVSTSYLGAGIFLAPMIGRYEPRGQHVLAYLLLGALAVVVVGSLLGEAAGILGFTDSLWFGNQGFEYLDLGRFWQVLLTIGLSFWVVILYRTLRGRLRTEHRGNLPWLFFYAALALPAFYAVGLLAHPESNFTITDFWRFWVVHLWVEDFLELFTTVMVAYMFVMLGVVRERTGLLVVYLHVILYSVGGVIGTMHHMYFSGTPVEHMALGAFFSAGEVIPLTFLTVEAWTFLRLGARQEEGSRRRFPHYWAVMFLVAVGFWNFLGAGVFGFIINLPIVSYYEIGTALTANHGHAAMMGVYGMLAVGLALFALRYLLPARCWSERLARTSFWCLNAGLAWMVFATLFPLGVVQLHQSVSHGYHEARQLDFLTSDLVRTIEWLRLPGDLLFIVGGIVPLLLLCWRGVRHRRPAAAWGEVDEQLFTDVKPAPRDELDVTQEWSRE